MVATKYQYLNCTNTILIRTSTCSLMPLLILIIDTVALAYIYIQQADSRNNCVGLEPVVIFIIHKPWAGCCNYLRWTRSPRTNLGLVSTCEIQVPSLFNQLTINGSSRTYHQLSLNKIKLLNDLLSEIRVALVHYLWYQCNVHYLVNGLNYVSRGQAYVVFK